MKTVLPKTHVKPTGIKLLLWILVVLIGINILGSFNILVLQDYQSDILTIGAILFVATEIGMMGMIRGKKKLDAISTFGGLVVILALLGLILGWFDVAVGFLEMSKGFVSLALLVYVVIEIFR